MMKKDLLGDILGEDEAVEAGSGRQEKTESLYDGMKEEQYTAQVEPEAGLETFAPKKRSAAAARIEMTSSAAPREEPSGMLYVQARRVAEMKFRFIKQAAFLGAVNALFFFLAFYQVQPSGKYWFVWPLAVSLVFLGWHYLVAFVLKGRNLHSVIERTIHRMAMRESQKIEYRDR
jgi:hypothetical protein